MGKVMMSGVAPQMTKPSVGILLSDIAEGSIVKLNESGSPVEFYVAKHDYESALNGAGRTLLVRKDCYDIRAWHKYLVNAYSTSNIDTWLNGDYKVLLDANVQTAIGTTKFYYTPGNGNTKVTKLERSIFLLSVTELGKTGSASNKEGSALPIASTLQIAYRNGSAVTQWTRSPNTDFDGNVYCLNPGGNVGFNDCNITRGSRPAFTFPSTTLFDTNTLIMKGVA